MNFDVFKIEILGSLYITDALNGLDGYWGELSGILAYYLRRQGSLDALKELLII